MAERLSRMQIECIRRAIHTDKEIALELGISPHTVSLHVREAIRRLGATGRRDALKILAVHPLYGDVEILGLTVIVSGGEASVAPAMRAPTSRPTLFGRELPPLPGVMGRIGWVAGTFIVLAVGLLIGIAVVNTLVDLTSRYAPQ